MKSKNLFPGICLLLLIISEIFWFSANRQKSLAQEQLRVAQQQIMDLQARLGQLTNSTDADQTAEAIRLRAENTDLPRLRTQVQQLEAENGMLASQLSAARAAAGQRQTQLEEIEAQDEQAAASQQAQSQAVEQTVAQTEAEEKNACINNLRIIYAAKQEWALEKNKTDADIPTEQDLLPYLKGGVFPVCPAGGVYTIGAVGQPPTCSIPGHVLPAP